MYEFKFQSNGLGQIRIDDFIESFEADYSFWSREQYEEQWLDASRKVNLNEPACFITSITEPKHTNFIRCWVCYSKGDKLAFQEHILFLDELDEPLDLANPHKHVGEYSSLNEDGEKISEWSTLR